VMSPFTFQPGQVLMDKYRVECVLAQGGMGIVVQAVQLGLDRRVALKFLTKEAFVNPDALGRFEREARIAARLRSEHVARVLDIARLPDGTPCIVMEFLEGSDLEALSLSGPLPVERAVGYVLQACEALAEAHAAGIVHRDLKPANLFLTERLDGRPLVKVLDFGISKLAEEAGAVTIRTTGGAMGTPQYMSPEQFESTKDVTPHADIWSLGAILYELVAGKPPFDAPSVPRLCVEILHGEPVPLGEALPGVPAGLEAVVARCLEKRPEDRYPTVGALARALAPYAPPELRSAADAAQALVDGGGRSVSDRPSVLGGAVLDLQEYAPEPITALPLVRRASEPPAGSGADPDRIPTLQRGAGSGSGSGWRRSTALVGTALLGLAAGALGFAAVAVSQELVPGEPRRAWTAPPAAAAPPVGAAGPLAPVAPPEADRGAPAEPASGAVLENAPGEPEPPQADRAPGEPEPPQAEAAEPEAEVPAPPPPKRRPAPRRRPRPAPAPAADPPPPPAAPAPAPSPNDLLRYR
jgi:eukaryotic-like serine/threonine-protein kinase